MDAEARIDVASSEPLPSVGGHGVDLGWSSASVRPPQAPPPEPPTIDTVADFPIAHEPPAAASVGLPRVAVVAGLAGLALAAVLISRVLTAGAPAPTAAPEPTAARPVPTSAPAIATVTVSATPVAAAIRVTAEPARYTGNCAQYGVVFAWTLAGARAGDPIVIDVRKGEGPPARQSFTLVARSEPSGVAIFQAFDPDTGRLRLGGATDAGPTPGFSATVVTVRSQPATGDTVSRAPAHCG